MNNFDKILLFNVIMIIISLQFINVKNIDINPYSFIENFNHTSTTLNTTNDIVSFKYNSLNCSEDRIFSSYQGMYYPVKMCYYNNTCFDCSELKYYLNTKDMTNYDMLFAPIYSINMLSFLMLFIYTVYG